MVLIDLDVTVDAFTLVTCILLLKETQMRFKTRSRPRLYIPTFEIDTRHMRALNLLCLSCLVLHKTYPMIQLIEISPNHQ